METSTVGITGALGRLQARSRRRTIITAATGIVVVAGLLALYLLVLAPKPTGPPRLAVLPFEEIGPTNEEWFADAIANEVRSGLSVLRGLEVVTYLGADQYRTENKTPWQIGNELGVDYLLRASIQWEQLPNEQTQITLFPELIRATDGKNLPVEPCEGTLTGAGITLLQRTLSELVIRELGVVLLEPEQQFIQQNPTEDIVAFNLYSLGRYHWNRRNLEQAIDYFQKAIERDPDYAQAYAGLAATYTICSDWALYPASETHPLAKAAAWKALELNESLAEAYAALAYTSYEFDWDFDTAEILFQKAINLDPDYATAHQWYAEYLCAMSNFEMAFEEIERARTLDPTSLMVNSVRGIIYAFNGQYEKSIEQYLKVLELDPKFYPAYEYLSWSYVPLKRFEEAFEVLATARELSNNEPGTLSASAIAYAFADSIHKAMEFANMLLERSRQEEIPPYLLSSIYAAMGDKDKAFEWLDIAYKEKEALRCFVWVAG